MDNCRNFFDRMYRLYWSPVFVQRKTFRLLLKLGAHRFLSLKMKLRWVYFSEPNVIITQRTVNIIAAAVWRRTLTWCSNTVLDNNQASFVVNRFVHNLFVVCGILKLRPSQTQSWSLNLYSVWCLLRNQHFRSKRSLLYDVIWLNIINSTKTDRVYCRFTSQQCTIICIVYCLPMHDNSRVTPVVLTLNRSIE